MTSLCPLRNCRAPARQVWPETVAEKRISRLTHSTHDTQLPPTAQHSAHTCGLTRLMPHPANHCISAVVCTPQRVSTAATLAQPRVSTAATLPPATHCHRTAAALLQHCPQHCLHSLRRLRRGHIRRVSVHQPPSEYPQSPMPPRAANLSSRLHRVASCLPPLQS